MRERSCADGLVLDGAEIGERIGAGVVVVLVAADVAAEVEDAVVADDAGVGWGDVEGADLGALVGVADVAEDGVWAGASADDVRRR